MANPLIEQIIGIAKTFRDFGVGLSENQMPYPGEVDTRVKRFKEGPILDEPAIPAMMRPKVAGPIEPPLPANEREEERGRDLLARSFDPVADEPAIPAMMRPRSGQGKGKLDFLLNLFNQGG